MRIKERSLLLLLLLLITFLVGGCATQDFTFTIS